MARAKQAKTEVEELSRPEQEREQELALEQAEAVNGGNTGRRDLNDIYVFRSVDHSSP